MIGEQLPLWRDMLPTPPRGRTVEAEQMRLLHGASDGASCACCGQLVKVYRRSIYAAMARWLIRLAKLGGGLQRERHWVDQSNLATRGGDYAKLQHWGLIERQPKDPQDTARRTSGLWRVTPAGLAWARNETRVPRHALIYLNRCVGFEGERVGVLDCLADTFDYATLWL